MALRSRHKSLLRGVLLTLGACLALCGVVAVVIGTTQYLRNRPYVWKSTEAKLAYRAKVYEGRVFSTDGWYMVNMPNSRWTWMSIEPKNGYVSSQNPPDRIFGQLRTSLLGGVHLTGGGKTDTLGVVRRTENGYRVVLTDMLPSGKVGATDEFEIQLPTKG